VGGLGNWEGIRVDFTFGDTTAQVDARDGCVVQVRRGRRRYLLDEATERWHTSEQRWGKGFAITDVTAGRWDAPEHLEVSDGVVRARYGVAGALTLDVERRFGATWRERYAFRAAAPLTVLTLGIHTPWRDVYASAADALTGAVHAHVWPGGRYSYALAQPMDDAGPVLGLRTEVGALWAYSIESREERVTSSNARGHIVMHPTDAGRAPSAFGGQPRIRLRAGEAYVLEWELGWYESVAAFLDEHRPPVALPRLVAPVGEPIGTWRSEAEGERYVEVAGSRVAVAWHAPLHDVVERRVRFILARQRARHRAGVAAAALLPYDNERGLPLAAGGWADFSDARERIGMGLLLQQAVRHGCAGAEAEEALAAYRRFVRECVLTDDGRAREDSHRPQASARLYDLPWLVLLFCDSEPEVALRLLRAYYDAGGERFLAIGAGLAAQRLARVLPEAQAAEITGWLHGHARASVSVRGELPAHEVNYEQSMVAPLLEILCCARAVSGDASLDAEIVERLPWLLAFGGPQPHVRMRDIAIRHWDGYWFGREKLWGDVFPHHWSALTANVLMLLPEAAQDEVRRRRGISARRLAEQIYAANLIDFRPDGSATAGFVMPSCVSGRVAHRADPVANDQDWALYWPLLLSEPPAAAI
jgi:hypothetical protein